MLSVTSDWFLWKEMFGVVDKRRGFSFDDKDSVRSDVVFFDTTVQYRV